MSKSYTPVAEADAIIARQIAKGYFTTPDEAVRGAITPPTPVLRTS
jgi:hypothetical protein